MFRTRRHRIVQGLIVAACLVLLAGCAVAPTRIDDPYQGFNRKMFAFDMAADKHVVRPVAKAYVKVTNEKERTIINNFFSNLRAPIVIINEILQGRPIPALQSTGRFLVNSTLGILGFLDPANGMNLPAHTTDFAVTLADWGVPQGPYLVLPFIGPTTLRDVWRLPVDSYFDPMAWFVRENHFKWYAEYAPEGFYLVTLRARLLPYDQMLDSAYDPYAFMRDAYLQHRLYLIYHGNPPLSAIEDLQGTSTSEENGQDIEQLLHQQEQYEKTHGKKHGARPAPAGSTPPPASAQPAPAASSSPAPASSSLKPASPASGK